MVRSCDDTKIWSWKETEKKALVTSSQQCQQPSGGKEHQSQISFKYRTMQNCTDWRKLISSRIDNEYTATWTFNLSTMNKGTFSVHLTMSLQCNHSHDTSIQQSSDTLPVFPCPFTGVDPVFSFEGLTFDFCTRLKILSVLAFACIIFLKSILGWSFGTLT